MAKLGPDSTATGRAPRTSCAITSDTRSSVSCSMPFVALTMSACREMNGAADRMTARVPCDGSAATTMSAR